MGFLRLLKYIFLGENEKQYDKYLLEQRFELFKFLYFLRWKNEVHLVEKFAKYYKGCTKFFYKSVDYSRISVYIYLLLILFFYIIFISPRKNLPFYVSLIAPLVALTLSITFKFFFIRRTKIKFSVSLLIDALVIIIFYIDGEPERMIRTVSDLETAYLPTVTEKIRQLQDSYSDQKPQDKKKTLEDRYGDLFREKLVLNSLEEAATYAETYIPSRLRSKDAATDAWFKNSMGQVAASIRDKKKWVLTPKQDTYDILITNITVTLICIVNGNWDALERTDVFKGARSQTAPSFLSLLLRIFRTLVVAILPLSGLIVFLLTPMANALTGTTRDIFAILVSLWFGITILRSIDKDFDAKFSILNDLRSFLP